MAWKRVIKNSDLEKCLGLIRNSADHYKDWPMETLKHAIKRKRAEVYYYNSVDYKIMLMFQWNYTKKMWRVKNGAFTGPDGREAMIISWDKVREFYKEKGEKTGYLIMPDYENFKNGHQEYFKYLWNEESDIIEIKRPNRLRKVVENAVIHTGGLNRFYMKFIG